MSLSSHSVGILDRVREHVPSALWPLVCNYAFGPLDELVYEMERYGLSISLVEYCGVVTHTNFHFKMRLPVIVRHSGGVISIRDPDMMAELRGCWREKIRIHMPYVTILIKRRHIVEVWYLMSCSNALRYLLDQARLSKRFELLP